MRFMFPLNGADTEILETVENSEMETRIDRNPLCPYDGYKHLKQ